MERFEFVVVRGLLFGARKDTLLKNVCRDGEDLPQYQDQPLAKLLNDYGTEGWDVVPPFSPRPGDGFCVVFKRRTG